MDDYEIHILNPDGSEANEAGLAYAATGLKPERLAEELAALATALREALHEKLPVTDDYSARGRFALNEIEISVAVSAEGSIGIVKGSATGSIALRFTRA